MILAWASPFKVCVGCMAGCLWGVAGSLIYAPKNIWEEFT